MGMNWGKPATTDNYSTGFVPGIQDNQAALAMLLDSTLVSLAGTTPSGAKRYNRTSSALEEWNGSAWAPITLHGLQFASTGLGLGAAPTANERFRVEGAEARIRSRNSTSGVEVYLGAMNPGEARVWAATNTPLTFGVNNAELARFDTSGNFCIGNTSPGVTGLAVGNAARTGANFVRVFTSTTDLYMGQSSGTVFGYASGAAAFYTSVGSPVAYGTSSAHELVLGTNSIERLRVDPAGRLLNKSNQAWGTAATNHTLGLMGGDATGTFGASGAALALRGSTVGSNNSGMEFFAGGSEQMRLDSSGRLGIGLTAPTCRIDIAEGTANLLARFRNTTAASYGEVHVASNDRAFVMGQRSSTHAAGDLAYFLSSTATPIAWYINGTERLRLTADGRLYGTALHNNAGSVAGATNQYIASGSYTPGVTHVANISASTPRKCTWIRVGNVVRVAGACTVTTAAGAGTATQLRIALPIPSNLAIGDLYGNGSFAAMTTMLGGGMGADAANDEAVLVWTSNAAATFEVAFDFSYEVNP